MVRSKSINRKWKEQFVYALIIRANKKTKKMGREDIDPAITFGTF